MQSRFVAQRILELREEGVELGEMAVLFRSSFHSFDLELELQRRDIPFIKRGGFKFIETAHIKDVLAHLRVVANPADAVSWLRALMLVRGVGHRTAERTDRDAGNRRRARARTRASGAIGRTGRRGVWLRAACGAARGHPRRIETPGGADRGRCLRTICR